MQVSGILTSEGHTSKPFMAMVPHTYYVSVGRGAAHQCPAAAAASRFYAVMQSLDPWVRHQCTGGAVRARYLVVTVKRCGDTGSYMFNTGRLLAFVRVVSAVELNHRCCAAAASAKREVLSRAQFKFVPRGEYHTIQDVNLRTVSI